MSLQTNFFKEPAELYHRSIVLNHVLSRRLRSFLSVFAGAVVLVYLIVSFAVTLERLFPSAMVETFFSSYAVDTFSSVYSRGDVPSAPCAIALPTQSIALEFFAAFVRTPCAADNTTPIAHDVGQGIFSIALGLWIVLRMLKSFENSYLYYVEGLLERGKVGARTPYTIQNFDVAEIYDNTEHGDLVKSFVYSDVGRLILHRIGVDRETGDNYVSHRARIVNFLEKKPDLRHVFTLSDLAKALTILDPDFFQFLCTHGAREKEFMGAAEWIERELKQKRQRDRSWGRVALGYFPSIGSGLAYGRTRTLERFSEDLTKRAQHGGVNFHFVFGSEEITRLEIVLARAREANALLVGEDGGGTMDVIRDFARDIMNGYTHPSLAQKRVMLFDTAFFLSAMHTKQEVESTFARVLQDARHAGNIIFVIDDFPGFLLSAKALDADVLGILDPYLSGTALHVIATADNARFHQLIEPSHAIMRRFEKIVISQPNDSALMRIVEDFAVEAEKSNTIFFTYQGIVEIVHSARRYFSDGVLPDKAIDLIVEITPALLMRGEHVVRKADVLSFVRDKTGVPMGEVSSGERALLSEFELRMSKLVVGQTDAIALIGSALRRARAGVSREDKPIGSFLFLGPTGVGKTETAKALATVYFGSPTALARLDMSEFQGDDGLLRLVGDMSGTQGVLANMLREQPYGVFLLDEFEKSHHTVRDLFLQVFDEGYFHDAGGKRVNAQNTIFIATSNAGAEIIRDHKQESWDDTLIKKEIIDHIVSMGIMKPELLNRFDGVIIFRPLGLSDYRRVATIMLERLAKRLRDEQGLHLVIDDIMLDALMTVGVDPLMGARPMARAVQELVEQKVAERLIRGGAAEGTTLAFTKEELLSK